MRALPDLIAKRADLSPDAPALEEYGGASCSYLDLNAAAGRAAGLMAREGVAAGDRVAVLCRSRIAFFELLFACAKLGAVLIPLNWRSPAQELRPLLDASAPRLMFFGAEDEAAARAAAPDAVLIGLDVAGPTGYAARKAAADPLKGRREWPSDETWYLLHTSGTTGRPKAVINTFGMALVNAINIGSGIGLTAGDRTVNVLPLFHAGGIGLHTLPALFAGAKVTLLASFDPDALIGMIAQAGLDLFFGVPAIYQQLSLRPGFEALDLTTVRHWGCGGAPLPDALVRRFAALGALVCNGMGMTETGPTLFLMDQASVQAKIGSVGKPQILAEARIVDADGKDVAPGDTGELWFAGPGITPGYWNDPVATAAAFGPGGWLKSGDLARQDADGYYFIVGRSKDMFISGGENVYPAEVENVLADHPAVLEAAVGAVADARWGEVGRAYLVLRPGATADDVALDGWCRARLAAYKAPKSYVFAADLPRNALGKVLKHRLSELDPV